MPACLCRIAAITTALPALASHRLSTCVAGRQSSWSCHVLCSCKSNGINRSHQKASPESAAWPLATTTSSLPPVGLASLPASLRLAGKGAVKGLLPLPRRLLVPLVAPGLVKDGICHRIVLRLPAQAGRQAGRHRGRTGSQGANAQCRGAQPSIHSQLAGCTRLAVQTHTAGTAALASPCRRGLPPCRAPSARSLAPPPGGLPSSCSARGTRGCGRQGNQGRQPEGVY